MQTLTVNPQWLIEPPPIKDRFFLVYELRYPAYDTYYGPAFLAESEVQTTRRQDERAPDLIDEVARRVAEYEGGIMIYGRVTRHIEYRPTPPYEIYTYRTIVITVAPKGSSPAILTSAVLAKIIHDVIILIIILIIAFVLAPTVRDILWGKTPTPLEKFPCPYCDVTTTTAEAMEAHKLEAHALTRFVCPYCALEFDTPEERDSHVDEWHKPKPIVPGWVIGLVAVAVIAVVVYLLVRAVRRP